MKLVRFVMRLVNEEVIVELKNGTIIKGTVVSADVSMNMHMRNIKMTIKNRNPVSFDHLSIRGSSVRHIIIPDTVPLDTLLIDDTPAERPAKIQRTAGRAMTGRGLGMRGGRGGGGRGGGRGRGGPPRR